MTRRKSVALALYRCLVLSGAIYCSSCQSVSSGSDNQAGQNESKPRVFSPRMDYDEWTPLGRGDPLKNNPTFDYVPPVLDRVQYWLDSHTTESSLKRDVLVLGVTAKKTSPKIPEQFLKFVDGPKFSKNSNQDTSYRNDFTGSGGAEPPKLMRTTSFRNGPTIDYRNQNRIQSLPASYYPSPFYGHKSKPYTMMLPPPLVQKDKIVTFVEPTQQFSTQTEEGPVLREPSQFYVPSKNYNNQHPPSTKSQSPQSFKSPNKGHIMVSQVETIKSVLQGSSTTQPPKSRLESVTAPSVSFEKSNLIYQSTQTVSSGWPNSVIQSTPSTAFDSNQPHWQVHDYNRDHYEIDHHVAASSNQHEVVVEQQNANIIVDGDTGENDEVIIGQKEAVPSTPARLTTDLGLNGDQKQAETEEKMHIVLANSSGSQESEREPVAVVMPTNYSEKKPPPSSPTVPEAQTSSPEASTVEPEVNSHRQPEPPRNLPMMPEESHQAAPPFSGAMIPNRMMQSHRQHLHPQPGPRQPPPGSLHSFGFPQAPLQSMMHPQTRPNHAMMQFLGSMRPGMGFRAPGPMAMFPPMTHMHAPPMKQSHMAPMDQSHMAPMDQSHLAAPMDQHHQEFSVTFTESPVQSSMSDQLAVIGIEEDREADRHRSRLPETTTPIPITSPTISPLLPTVSTVEHPSETLQTHDPQGSPQNSLLDVILTREKEEDADTRPQVTTVQSLTTDPIFSHYKQPAKPIRGPMYLIIQGHSKVKTYKPTVTKHGVPKNEIKETTTDRQLSKFEQFIKENTKSGNATTNAAILEKKKAEEKARAEKIAQARQNSLMSLVESGLGSFAVSPSPSSSSSSATLSGEEEYQPNSVTTIEINGN